MSSRPHQPRQRPTTNPKQKNKTPPLPDRPLTLFSLVVVPQPVVVAPQEVKGTAAPQPLGVVPTTTAQKGAVERTTKTTTTPKTNPSSASPRISTGNKERMRSILISSQSNNRKTAPNPKRSAPTTARPKPQQPNRCWTPSQRQARRYQYDPWQSRSQSRQSRLQSRQSRLQSRSQSLRRCDTAVAMDPTTNRVDSAPQPRQVAAVTTTTANHQPTSTKATPTKVQEDQQQQQQRVPSSGQLSGKNKLDNTKDGGGRRSSSVSKKRQPLQPPEDHNDPAHRSPSSVTTGDIGGDVSLREVPTTTTIHQTKQARTTTAAAAATTIATTTTRILQDKATQSSKVVAPISTSASQELTIETASSTTIQTTVDPPQDVEPHDSNDDGEDACSSSSPKSMISLLTQDTWLIVDTWQELQSQWEGTKTTTANTKTRTTAVATGTRTRRNNPKEDKAPNRHPAERSGQADKKKGTTTMTTTNHVSSTECARKERMITDRSNRSSTTPNKARPRLAMCHGPQNGQKAQHCRRRSQPQQQQHRRRSQPQQQQQGQPPQQREKPPPIRELFIVKMVNVASTVDSSSIVESAVENVAQKKRLSNDDNDTKQGPQTMTITNESPLRLRSTNHQRADPKMIATPPSPATRRQNGPPPPSSSSSLDRISKAMAGASSLATISKPTTKPPKAQAAATRTVVTANNRCTHPRRRQKSRSQVWRELQDRWQQYLAEQNLTIHSATALSHHPGSPLSWL